MDENFLLAVELRDDSQDDIQEALRSAVYSKTKSCPISYVAIFESLWKQVELIDQVNSLCKQAARISKPTKENLSSIAVMNFVLLSNQS